MNLQETNCIRCPRCGKLSFNAGDIAELYCGFCKLFHHQFGTEVELFTDHERAESEVDRLLAAYSNDAGLQALVNDWREANRSLRNVYEVYHIGCGGKVIGPSNETVCHECGQAIAIHGVTVQK